MPSRKQRRRRQKDRRHEYEYVYVDEEGHELEAPPDEEHPRPRDKKSPQGKRGERYSKGAGREPNPPSWARSGRRGLLFLPLFFIVFSLVNKHSGLGPRILASVGYSVLFIPLTYMIDRTTYRSHLRRSGRDAGAKR
jgi:hypothetical protein